MKKKSLQINIKSVNINAFKIYNLFFQKILKKLNIKHSIFHLPTKRKRITLLKAPHVYKKAREQFEYRCYKSCIQISDKIKISILNWLLINKPAVVQIKIKTTYRNIV